MPSCPRCNSANVDYENQPPNRSSEGIIIYHCRDCGFTEKRETGKAYALLGSGVGKATFQQRIDEHYRQDDALRARWSNPREEIEE